jgi:hypothetical protein
MRITVLDKQESVTQKWKREMAVMGVFESSWCSHVNQVDQTGSDGILQRARKDVYSDDGSTHETELDT